MTTVYPPIRKIKKFRERVGLSQNEVASIVGVSQSAITKYEKGLQIPSYTVGTKIFEVLPHNYEIVYVNDGSIDGTGDLVRKWSRDEAEVALHLGHSPCFAVPGDVGFEAPSGMRLNFRRVFETRTSATKTLTIAPSRATRRRSSRFSANNSE